MRKSEAIHLLGGTSQTAADAIGVTRQAVEKWPDELPPRIEDRVVAAIARKHLPACLISNPPQAAPTEDHRKVDVGVIDTGLGVEPDRRA
jgi:hypothetical protein